MIPEIASRHKNVCLSHVEMCKISDLCKKTFWFDEAKGESGFVPQLETVIKLLPCVRGQQLHTVQNKSNSHISTPLHVIYAK